MKTPCQNCICVPICRHKKFPELIEECSHAYEFLSLSIEGPEANWVAWRDEVIAVEEHLRPTLWESVSDGKYCFVGSKTGDLAYSLPDRGSDYETNTL